MNGAQDLGGQMGFGPIELEDDEPNFHAKWEERAFALTLAMGGTRTWSIDRSRYMRESLPPAEYLSSSYYQIWLKGLERLMLSHGLITGEELVSGRMLEPAKPLNNKLMADQVAAALAKGGPANRAPQTPAAFKPGDRVLAKRMNPEGHTRIPRYVRGCEGVIETVHGVHVFPDTNAHGADENPTWLYGVEFKGSDVWGADSDPSLTLRIDLWEPYLDRL